MEKPFSIIDTSNTQNIRDLNIILSISQGIISTLDYEEVLQIISNGISELLEIETAAIYMLENEKELILAATTPPLDPNIPDSVRRAALKDHPNIQKAILGRKSILLPDTKTAKLSPAEKSVVELRQLRSLLYLPFIQQEKVLGVLILGTCNKSKKFSDHEIEIVQMLANQLSVAIQNSRFHVDLKNYKENLEKLVAERTYELNATNEELKSTNEELHEKNKIVMQQKEELQATLNNLKSMKAKLIQSEKMASLGILTAGVAHEINNPLNFISGSYFGLERFFTNKAPEYKNDVAVLLNGLRTGIERASDVVQGLNHFSRDSKKYNEKCDIHSIINNCLLILKNRYKDRIEIKKQYENDSVIIIGNEGKLHQVFLNILTNAVQSIEKNGEISIETKKLKNNIKVIIKDNGCGMNQKDISKIIEPFFTTKDPGKGIGLGLSISYNIIKEHNGDIDFESKLNKGTSVKITLPLK